MKGLLDYRDINSSISQAISEKLKRHLWYLSEENIVLALFDDAVSLATKRKMLLAMKRNNNDQEVEKPEKRCNWSLATVAKSNLDSFVSSKSVFFEILNIDTDLLKSDPSTWEINPSFNSTKEKLKSLQVVRLPRSKIWGYAWSSLRTRSPRLFFFPGS